MVLLTVVIDRERTLSERVVNKSGFSGVSLRLHNVCFIPLIVIVLELPV